ncbi:antitoxin ParD1/3/4 [Rhodopseudomonas thermotolerans]|uniref:Antitoxin ParD1/3/4 n=3 Tax=Rhodopseudomonas TaxID=1073 RepID=A0A336JXE5_9BRAD|nr:MULTISPECIES: type II toxin-antitoxin system ParD family antitoxin [Rhodopseudomonas]PZA10784.1 type II toxin-antitoxin system ParD family antitoxin [Rhodopseudomonas palustris]RED26102.1 antitoxin ParD1/3/4 [Rhodopseudomonas pentothenatexigens]REF91063.1 antitoxin ParD1/3/4 [Rhodopseudomonas thermotolerans]SSW93026.1 antitoxin ParD1/3/4 [Rhodopseudomonas pentothenatexigens]
MAGSYTLDEHSAAFVDSLVESGRYETAGDVVRESLRQMQAREAKLEALRAEIQKGLDSGPGEEFDAKTLAEDVKRRGRERLAAARAAASKSVS